jgi:DNA-directed RNA polymerase subunit M/transcription elongation factor TFIIS
MGKANAFFIVYGKLTGQDLGEGETAGDNVPDGETEPGDGGGVAMADDENAPPFSKEDVQKMLKGEFPADAPEKPKASMDTSIPGEEPSAPMAGPPPSRLAKGNPPVEKGSEAEKIIKTLYKQAKVNPSVKLSKQNPIRIDGDKIIDLYKRAKAMPPEEGEKLIAFLKSGAILPLEEGKITKYQLQNLIEVIVEGIVDEVEEAKKKAKKKKSPKLPTSQPKGPDDDIFQDVGEKEPEHSQMDWEPSGENRPQQQRGDKYEQWLVDLANKMWKDPEDIGHHGQGWRIKRVVPHGPDTTAYLLTLTKQYHKSRIFLNKNGRWFWKDPINRHQGWQEVEGPVTEPSIEQETLSPWINQPPPEPSKQKATPKSKSASGGGERCPTCAGKKAKSVGEMNQCPSGHLWTIPRKDKTEESDETLDEMTTTSGGGGSSAGTPGYNIPGAFGRKMTNRKKHIEVLGYKMTPEGEKEYEKPADKLYEAIKRSIKQKLQEASGLGADFDRAQRAYDAQMPPESDDLQCPQCGGESGFYTDKGHRRGAHWYSAECPDCGHTWGDDNFDSLEDR